MNLVVVESVAVIPERLATAAEIIHGAGDREEMLEEFRSDVLVDGIYLRQLQRDLEQVQRVHRHPARAVGLFERAARGQRLRAIEDPDVVEPEKAAFKHVAAG